MLTKALFGKFSTLSEQVKGVVVDLKSEEFTNHTLDLLNAWITKFKYVTAVVAD